MHQEILALRNLICEESGVPRPKVQRILRWEIAKDGRAMFPCKGCGRKWIQAHVQYWQWVLDFRYIVRVELNPETSEYEEIKVAIPELDHGFLCYPCAKEKEATPRSEPQASGEVVG